MELEKRNIEILDDQMVKVLKAKRPQERLAIAFNMWSFAKNQLINYLTDLHPEWSKERIQKDVARRLLHGAI